MILSFMSLAQMLQCKLNPKYFGLGYRCLPFQYSLVTKKVVMKHAIKALKKISRSFLAGTVSVL